MTLNCMVIDIFYAAYTNHVAHWIIIAGTLPHVLALCRLPNGELILPSYVFVYQLCSLTSPYLSFTYIHIISCLGHDSTAFNFNLIPGLELHCYTSVTKLNFSISGIPVPESVCGYLILAIDFGITVLWDKQYLIKYWFETKEYVNGYFKIMP